MNKEKLLTNVECDITENTKCKNEKTLLKDITREKKCSRCKKILSYEMFKEKKNGKLNCYCKLCQPIIYKNWEINNIEKVKKQKKIYREINRDKIKHRQQKYMKCWSATLKARFIFWKKGAIRRGIPFDLTLEQLESMPRFCYYTGKELVLESNKHNTISLDRLDSTKGYTKDNVVYCCVFINLMKHELSYDKLIETCNTILTKHKERFGLN